MKTVKDRIIEFYESKGLSKREFERSINAGNGYIDKLRICPSPKKLEMIYLQYPELNKAWLLTGEGDMLGNNQSNDTCLVCAEKDKRIAELKEEIDRLNGEITFLRGLLSKPQSDDSIQKVGGL